MKAERWEDFKKILLNVDWLYGKLERLDVPALLSDFNWLDREKALSLVQGAIRLSAHIVGKFHPQLVGQLLGRLQTLKSSEIQTFLGQAKRWKKLPWLRPLQGNLIAPGGPLIRTLSGHGDSVRAVAGTPDGRRAISASGDHTCKVWDLAGGEDLHTLSGHGDSVRAVAVTPGGRRAISASGDHTCKVWDLVSGEEVATFTGESSILCCAVSPDGRTIVIGEQSGRVHFFRLEGVD